MFIGGGVVKTEAGFVSFLPFCVQSDHHRRVVLLDTVEAYWCTPGAVDEVITLSNLTIGPRKWLAAAAGTTRAVFTGG